MTMPMQNMPHSSWAFHTMASHAVLPVLVFLFWNFKRFSMLGCFVRLEYWNQKNWNLAKQHRMLWKQRLLLILTVMLFEYRQWLDPLWIFCCSYERTRRGPWAERQSLKWLRSTWDGKAWPTKAQTGQLALVRPQINHRWAEDWEVWCHNLYQPVQWSLLWGFTDTNPACLWFVVIFKMPLVSRTTSYADCRDFNLILDTCGHPSGSESWNLAKRINNLDTFSANYYQQIEINRKAKAGCFMSQCSWSSIVAEGVPMMLWMQDFWG